MIKLEKKMECTGCSACVSVCPRKCIQLKADAEGFEYPYIDKEKCTNCGLCDQVCPQKNSGKYLGKPMYALAAYSLSTEVKKRSTSGGIFYELAKITIEQGGSVYGAVFDSQWRVCHTRIDKVVDIVYMQGSKYLQSSTRCTFQRVKEDLMQGKKVLFSGTPCQVSGLKAFLGDNYNSLTCVGLICHGVASPAVWDQYISMLECRYNGKVDRRYTPTFRSKKEGWNNPSICIPLTNNRKYRKDQLKDPYMWLFINNYILRPSCYACECKRSNRSDITLGDFWGIKQVCEKMYDTMGTSAVLIHTLNGQTLFEEAKKNLIYQYVAYEKVLIGNCHIKESVAMPKGRKWVMQHITSNNFNIVVWIVQILTRLQSKIKSIWH